MSCADLGRFSALYSAVIYAPLFKHDPAAFRIYVLLVHEAAYQDKTVRRWNGHDFELGQGEVVTSQAWLSENSGCSRKVIRRVIDDLEAAGYVRANRGPTKSEKWANKGANKGTVFLVCGYGDLYAPKEKKGQQKGQRCSKKVSKKGQQTAEHSSLCINTNTHTQNAREGVCVSSFDEGKPASQPAEPCQTELQRLFLEHPIVIAWNEVADQSKLQRVSEATPDRLRALEAAFRFRNDPSWWRGVFRQAAKALTINGKPWRPSFDQCLELDRAVRYHESQQKVSHLRPVPKPPAEGAPPVECDSRDSAARHVPEEPQKPGVSPRLSAQLAELRRSLAPAHLVGNGDFGEAGQGRGLAPEPGHAPARAGGLPGAAGD